MSENLQIFTSIRLDPTLSRVPTEGLQYAGWNYHHSSSCYMLDFHRDRLLKAATHWNWQPAIDLLSGPQGLDHLNRVISEAVGPSQTNPLRLKILVRRDGTINCEKHNASAKPLVNLFPERLPHPGSAVTATDPKRTPEYEVLLDPAATARSEYTHYKTTKRDMYDSARERAKISHTDVKEVLVHLDNGEIMEGTITTPYFWRNDRWVTPPVAAEFHRNEGSGGQNGTTRRWALERGIAVEEPVNANSLVEGEECWISNGVRGFEFGKIKLGNE